MRAISPSSGIVRVAKLHRHEPLIKIEILASNAASDLQRREADIAIRNFPPTQPDLIARKVRNAHLRLYATPEYLDRIGKPKLPYDLREAEFISIDSSGMFLKGLNALGLNLTERNFPILSENILVIKAVFDAHPRLDCRGKARTGPPGPVRHLADQRKHCGRRHRTF